MPGLPPDHQNLLADEYLGMLVGLIISTVALIWVAVENNKVRVQEQMEKVNV